MTPATDERSICLLPRLNGIGGPASFQRGLILTCQRRNIRVHHDPSDPTCVAILIAGGSRQLWEIARARQRGVQIVQRLNGINWLHRVRRSSLKYYLRCEFNNFLLAFIRSRLADHIVYQSAFSHDWWHSVYHQVSAGEEIVYNGIDLDRFSAEGEHDRPADRYRLLMVEAHVGGGYEEGLKNSLRLLQTLNMNLDMRHEAMVIGDVDATTRQEMEKQFNQPVIWTGMVPHAEIPRLYRSAHFFFSADLNAACPNALLEALACGLPAVAFATGSLPELISQETGRVVPYGSNYWKLEAPKIEGLAAAAREILANQAPFRAAARASAVERFSLEHMTDRYLAALNF